MCFLFIVVSFVSFCIMKQPYLEYWNLCLSKSGLIEMLYEMDLTVFWQTLKPLMWWSWQSMSRNKDGGAKCLAKTTLDPLLRSTPLQHSWPLEEWAAGECLWTLMRIQTLSREEVKPLALVFLLGVQGTCFRKLGSWLHQL